MAGRLPGDRQEPQGSGKSHLARLGRIGRRVVIAAAKPRGRGGGLARLALEAADRSLCAEGLFHLINIAAREGGGLLLTARTLPATWATELPDLRSRLNALPVAEIGPPDDAVLAGVLRKFFRASNIRPPDEVYPYLLARRTAHSRRAEIVQLTNRRRGRECRQQILDEGF